MTKKNIESKIESEMVRDRRSRIAMGEAELKAVETGEKGPKTVENSDNTWTREEVTEIGNREIFDGYSVARELVTYYGKDDRLLEQFEMKSAFADSGCYLGDSEIAKLIVVKFGIVPESRSGKSEGDVCNIGWCEKEQKWYGWSHRAMYGFGIGTKVKKGDVGFLPATEADVPKDEYADWVLAGKPLGRGEWEAKTLEDAKEMACQFAKDIA
jgi:hypothetical protein